MKAISDTLIHFLGRSYKESPSKQLEIFKSIIEKGLKCSKIETVFSFDGMVFNQGVCFTDIPLNFCDEHIAVYGKFGIGFKKSFAKKTGGNPVRYYVDFPPTFKEEEGILEVRGTMSFMVNSLLKMALTVNSYDQKSSRGFFNEQGEEIISKENIKDIYKILLCVLSYEKPMGDLGPARDDAEDQDIYYKEREWRINAQDSLCKCGKAIKENGDYYIPFDRNDIRIIIVPSNDIQKHITNYLLELKTSTDNRLKEFGENMPPILNYDDLKYY